jgi:2-polyprenyl-6-methoxyphenol hydroxylase-like FAD-dependent oxidoreductase
MRSAKRERRPHPKEQCRENLINYDVLVVGGGPTGLWLARELALAPIRVAVLERLSEPTGLSKALGLQSRTMEMFEHRGILKRFTAPESNSEP